MKRNSKQLGKRHDSHEVSNLVGKGMKTNDPTREAKSRDVDFVGREAKFAGTLREEWFGLVTVANRT